MQIPPFPWARETISDRLEGAGPKETHMNTDLGLPATIRCLVRGDVLSGVTECGFQRLFVASPEHLFAPGILPPVTHPKGGP
jgi:hypothetical protein